SARTLIDPRLRLKTQDSRLPTRDSLLRPEVFLQRLRIEHRAQHKLIYDHKLVRNMRQLVIARIMHYGCDSCKGQVLRYRIAFKGLVLHRNFKLSCRLVETPNDYRVLVRNVRLSLVQNPGLEVSSWR